MPHPTPPAARDSEIADTFSRGRLLMFGGAFLLLSAAGIYTIYARLAERTFTFDWRLLSWPVVTGAAAMLLLYFVADGLRLHYAVRALGYRLPLQWVMRLVFINIFVSNVTPMATGGGLAQIWYLQKRGLPLGTAMAATTARTVLAVLFIFCAAPLATLLLKRVELADFSNQLIAYLALFSSAYLAFFVILLVRTRWLLVPLLAGLTRVRRWHWINEHRYRRWHFSIRRHLLHFRDGLRIYLGGARRYVFLSIVWTAIFLLTLFSFPALLLWGLGYELEYFTVIGIMVVTTFVMYFAPTPGASGIAEGVFGHLFAGLVTPAHLVLVIIAWRVLTIYIGMIIGIFAVHHELIGPGAKR